MNVSNQFSQIAIFLAENGFVTILKKLSAAFMPVIEIDGIAGQKPPHQRGNGNNAGAKQEMGMIGHLRPGKTGGLCSGQKPTQATQKVFPINIVSKYLPSFNAPNHNVVQTSGGI